MTRGVPASVRQIASASSRTLVLTGVEMFTHGTASRLSRSNEILPIPGYPG